MLSLYQPDLAEVQEQSNEGSESQELATELAELEDEDDETEADAQISEVENVLCNAISDMFLTTNLCKYKHMGCF